MLLDYLKTSPSTFTIPLAYLINILLVVKLRNMMDISKKAYAAMAGALMTMFGMYAIRFFYQLSGILMPDILHSGIFGLFCLGVLFIYVFSYLTHKPVGKVLDVFAIIMSVYGALNRLNCEIFGCCGGVTLWGNLRWPNRVLEIVFFLLAFVVFMQYKEKKQFHGQLFLWLMTGYGVFRFLNEFLSKGQILFCGLKISHIWAFLCAAIGFSIYSEMILRVGKNDHRKKNGGNLKC